MGLSSLRALQFASVGDKTGPHEQDSSSFCLTLNTLINWLKCEDILKWDPKTALVFLLSDLEKIVDATIGLTESQEGVIKTTSEELKGLQETFYQKLREKLTVDWKKSILKNIPLKRYKRRTGRPVSVSPPWTETLLLETLHVILREPFLAGNDSRVGPAVISDFIHCFLETLLDKKNGIKFSKSGGKDFAADVEYLLNKVTSYLEPESAASLRLNESWDTDILTDFASFIANNGKPESYNYRKFRSTFGSISGRVAPQGSSPGQDFSGRVTSRTPFDRSDHFVEFCSCL